MKVHYYVVLPGTFADTAMVTFACRSWHKTEAAAIKAAKRIGSGARIVTGQGHEKMGMYRAAGMA